jgi:hypothetical protein
MYVHTSNIYYYFFYDWKEFIVGWTDALSPTRLLELHAAVILWNYSQTCS